MAPDLLRRVLARDGCTGVLAYPLAEALSLEQQQVTDDVLVAYPSVDRLPTPWAPGGLSLTSLEGAGEVRTPLTGPPADHLGIGELVWFRHAEADEPFEHTATAHLLSGTSLVDEATTYRGHGLAC